MFQDPLFSPFDHFFTLFNTRNLGFFLELCKHQISQICFLDNYQIMFNFFLRPPRCATTPFLVHSKKFIFQNKASFSCSWLTSRLFYWAGGDTQSICLFKIDTRWCCIAMMGTRVGYKSHRQFRYYNVMKIFVLRYW